MSKQLYKSNRRTKKYFLESTAQDYEFSEETKSAMREARLMSEKKIPAQSFNNVEELLEDLNSDADD